MYKTSSAPLNNTTLWHCLGTEHLDFRCENNSTPGVLIKEIQTLQLQCPTLLLSNGPAYPSGIVSWVSQFTLIISLFLRNIDK